MEYSLASVRRHSRSAFWAAIDQGINPLLQLVLTPLFVARLGSQEFGLWILGLALVNMSQIVSGGAGIAATRYVAADLSASGRDAAASSVRAALSVTLLCSAVVVVIALVAAPVIAAHFLGAMGPAQRVAPILWMAVVAAAIQEVDGVFSGALRGAERFDLGAQIEVPARIAAGGLLLWLATRSGAAQPMFVGLIAALVIKAALKARRLAKLFPQRRCWLPSIRPEPLKRMWRFAAWQWLQSTGTSLFTSVDQLLAGALLGAGALTRYAVCLQLAQYVHLVPSVMLQIIFPRVSSLGSNLQPRAANSMLRSATMVAVASASVLGLPLILFARPVLAAWIGPVFAVENHWLLTVLVAVHIVLAVNIAAYFILLGRGQSDRSAKVVLSASLLQMIAAVALAPFGLLAYACNRLVYSAGTAFLYRFAHVRSNGH